MQLMFKPLSNRKKMHICKFITHSSTREYFEFPSFVAEPFASGGCESGCQEEKLYYDIVLYVYHMMKILDAQSPYKGQLPFHH